MKTIVFLVLGFFSTLTMANEWCDGRRTQREVMQCYESTVTMQTSRLTKIYESLRDHPSMTTEAFQQILFDHDNWTGILGASCQDPRCVYKAVENRNRALTARLNAMGNVPTVTTVQQAVPAQSAPEDALRSRCGAGTRPAMNRVCNNPSLWQMEIDLDESYKEALSNISDHGWIEKEQTDWIHNVRDVCRDDACLQKVYEERIDELFWIKKHSGE